MYQKIKKAIDTLGQGLKDLTLMVEDNKDALDKATYGENGLPEDGVDAVAEAIGEKAAPYGGEETPEEESLEADAMEEEENEEMGGNAPVSFKAKPKRQMRRGMF